MSAQAKTTRELRNEYRERFGVSFGVPDFAYSWTEKNTADEIAASLETGVPFDANSPRWPWSREPLPDGAVT